MSKKGGDRDAQINPTQGYKRMSLIIDPKLHRAFKIATASEGREMSEILIEFIEKYVREHPPAARLVEKGGGK